MITKVKFLVLWTGLTAQPMKASLARCGQSPRTYVCVCGAIHFGARGVWFHPTGPVGAMTLFAKAEGTGCSCGRALPEVR